LEKAASLEGAASREAAFSKIQNKAGLKMKE
jgi:hypothetical protein